MYIYNTIVLLFIFTTFDFLESADVPAHVTYQCRTDGWYVSLNMTSFGHGVTSSTANDVYLGKDNCTGVMVNSETLVFHYPLDSCGTTTETLREVLLFRNTLTLASRNSSSGSPVPVWAITLGCIFQRDQTVTLQYRPIVKTAASDMTTYPRSTEMMITPQQHSTQMRTTLQHHSTSSTAFTPVLCHVCTGQLCGVVTQTEAVQQCTDETPFCMNSVKVTTDGQKSYVKECVNKRTCEILWWQKTSDVDECLNFNKNKVYSGRDFECHYCCVSDNCNSDIYPKYDTLYQGST